MRIFILPAVFRGRFFNIKLFTPRIQYFQFKEIILFRFVLIIYEETCFQINKSKIEKDAILSMFGFLISKP